LQEIIDSAKPDIIIGTETWLDNTIPSTEFFPTHMFNVFRKDRPPNNKNKILVVAVCCATAVCPKKGKSTWGVEI
jgi:hypothetical protein